MFYNLFYKLKSKEEGYMKFIDSRLREWEKAKWGNLWDWIKSKLERQMRFLHWWVQEN